jgi:undecaprenyl-diphosphatase
MDKTLLLWINQDWAHPWLDFFFAWISQTTFFSIPLIFVILGVFVYRFGLNGVKLWLLTVLVIAAGDQLGALIKSITSFMRPCAALPDLVRIPVSPFQIYCSHMLTAMPSNHALNFFAFAVFTSTILHSRPWAAGFFILAALVSLSRIYLGVHFPSQVLAGFLIGLTYGYAAAVIALKYVPFVASIRAKFTPVNEKVV